MSLQVAEASGDSDCLDEAQIFADGLTKQPSGPERGFQGTALMRGVSSTSSTSRRPSPPPAPTIGGSGGGGTVDVEAELAAAAALEAGAGTGTGDIGELSDPILVCKLCTFHNKITAIHCGTCKGDLYPS